MRTDRTCHHCGFPVKRGRLPIIWPWEEGNTRFAFCSVHCLEADLNKTLPEPYRSQLLEGERCDSTT